MSHAGTWKHHLAPAGTPFISWPPSSELLPDEIDCPCCPGGTLNVADSTLAMSDGHGFCIDCHAWVAIEPDPRIAPLLQKLKQRGISCDVVIVVKQGENGTYPSARLFGSDEQAALAAPIVKPWITEYAEKWGDLTLSHD
jgi:hypothetical protein